jgi:hypothetical protein
VALLAEWYATSAGARKAGEAAIRRVLATAPAHGTRFLGSVFIPGDATAFFLFDGADVATVRGLLESAGINVDRLVEADADTILNPREESLDVS